jgi:hypothetical protein
MSKDLDDLDWEQVEKNEGNWNKAAVALGKTALGTAVGGITLAGAALTAIIGISCASVGIPLDPIMAILYVGYHALSEIYHYPRPNPLPTPNTNEPRADQAYKESYSPAYDTKKAAARPLQMAPYLDPVVDVSSTFSPMMSSCTSASTCSTGTSPASSIFSDFSFPDLSGLDFKQRL